MTFKLPFSSLSIKGYRSFNSSWQYFRQLGKVNILIGQNNSGKSNVLHFIHDWLAPTIKKRGSATLKEHDKHLPGKGEPGFGLELDLTDSDLPLAGTNFQQLNPSRKSTVMEIFKAKATADKSSKGPWFYFNATNELDPADWGVAFAGISDNRLHDLWGGLRNMSGGDRNRDWIPQILSSIQISRSSFESALVPAIRMIGIKDSVSDGFSGDGIIERLAKLQNPGAFRQTERKRFEDIGKFLQNVTDNATAQIEIPYERDTILVHMDGKVLPLESLGSGIHEVIILAAAATVLQGHVVCMEEPELHLNPILQKKLLRYLRSNTSNQYFITTHSAALMDTPDAEVYHITLKNGASAVERVTSDRHRSDVCQDLGYHPSDLLQTNSIIWVEGPSDRIYLNWWIRTLDKFLIEGIHYSVMFYGGRLASHLSAEDEADAVKDFISLRRLNRRGAILIDSDRSKKHARINATKTRLRDEFDTGPGHAWVTEGREIENYISPEILKKFIKDVHPSSQLATTLEKYDNALTIKSRNGKTTQASKVAVANLVVTSGPPDFSRYDLRMQVKKLVEFIKAANPG